ncbi:hypothetical protein WR25_26515 isoform C [Diploscapter pachys]|uniref:SXP/RAL-2 family protein Ani s 5-like cation-binding domain-containing protein n=1 Tax=Diploscapter pachys TaxID=2018661 RepID=A0A2A2LIH5_9BILA|nr:hypothetical protein WR25_26515 isoform C [Diploscapter pachys]
MRGLIASLVFLATLYSFSEAKSVSTYFKGPKHDEKVELMFTKIDVLKSVIPDEYKQTFISVFSLVFDTSKTPEVRFEEIRKLIPEEVQSKEDFEKKKAIIIGFMGKIDQLANYYTTEVAPTLTDNAKAVIKVYTDYIQQPQQFFKDGKDEMKKKVSFEKDDHFYSHQKCTELVIIFKTRN